jgi:hypothetical protein
VVVEVDVVVELVVVEVDVVVIKISSVKGDEGFGVVVVMITGAIVLVVGIVTTGGNGGIVGIGG